MGPVYVYQNVCFGINQLRGRCRHVGRFPSILRVYLLEGGDTRRAGRLEF